MSEMSRNKILTQIKQVVGVKGIYADKYLLIEKIYHSKLSDTNTCALLNGINFTLCSCCDTTYKSSDDITICKNIKLYQVFEKIDFIKNLQKSNLKAISLKNLFDTFDSFIDDTQENGIRIYDAMYLILHHLDNWDTSHVNLVNSCVSKYIDDKINQEKNRQWYDSKCYIKQSDIIDILICEYGKYYKLV